MNQWNHFLEFIQSFIAVDCNAQNSQILLNKSVLKNFKINICNDIDSWKFEQKFQIIEIFSHEFVKKMISIAFVFKIWTAYKSCLDNNKTRLITRIRIFCSDSVSFWFQAEMKWNFCEMRWNEIKNFVKWNEMRSDFYEMKWDEIRITWD